MIKNSVINDHKNSIVVLFNRLESLYTLFVILSFKKNSTDISKITRTVPFMRTLPVH